MPQFTYTLNDADIERLNLHYGTRLDHNQQPQFADIGEMLTDMFAKQVMRPLYEQFPTQEIIAQRAKLLEIQTQMNKANSEMQNIVSPKGAGGIK